MPPRSRCQRPIACSALDHELLRATIESPQDFSTAQQPYPHGTGLHVHCNDAVKLLGASIDGEGYSDFLHGVVRRSTDPHASV